MIFESPFNPTRKSWRTQTCGIGQKMKKGWVIAGIFLGKYAAQEERQGMARLNLIVLPFVQIYTRRSDRLG